MLTSHFLPFLSHYYSCVGDARIGSIDYSSGGELIPLASGRKNTKFSHPSYRSRTSDYDYMLLKLSSASIYAPVKLNSDANVPASFGDDLHVIGWGEDENGNFPERLQEAMVPYASCDYYGSSITERMMCAEYANSGDPTRESCINSNIPRQLQNHKLNARFFFNR